MSVISVWFVIGVSDASLEKRTALAMRANRASH